MENTYNEEQLETLSEAKIDACEHNDQQKVELVENGAEILEETGSSINKFKSYQELEKAYVNLEKEFTKKCQALKEMKEQVSDNATKQVVPQYELAGWEQKVEKFFENNPNAKQFAMQISNVIKSDKVLARSENSLEKAFDVVKANNFKTREEMLQDEEFVENYILKNSSIKDKVLEEYLSNIMSSKSATLMSGFGGGNVMLTPKKKPTSLKEAGDYMVALINNK